MQLYMRFLYRLPVPISQATPSNKLREETRLHLVEKLENLLLFERWDAISGETFLLEVLRQEIVDLWISLRRIDFALQQGFWPPLISTDEFEREEIVEWIKQDWACGKLEPGPQSPRSLSRWNFGEWNWWTSIRTSIRTSILDRVREAWRTGRQVRK